MAIKVKAEIKVVPEKPELLDKVFEQIEDLPEGKYTVYVLDNKPNRSLQQNRYYFGVVLRALKEHTGISVDDLHDLLKFRFNPKLIQFSGIEETKIGGSTKDLTTEAFMEYIERVRLWALEDLDGLYIPLPQEVTGEDYSELYVQATHIKL